MNNLESDALKDIQFENEQLKLTNELLRNYLCKALEDLDLACNSPRGFMEISFPVKTTLSYSSNTDLPNPTLTMGMWVWRYREQVKSLLENGGL